MGPNDVELVRVFTRQPAGPTADVTFPVGTAIEIVLEVEAGTTLMTGPAALYQAGVTLRDLTDGTNIPVTAPANAAGTIGAGGTWGGAASRSFVFSVAAQPATKQDHCLEALAFLRVGAAAAVPDVSFATSPLFIIHP